MLQILMVDDEPDLDLLIRQRFRHEIKDGIYNIIFCRNGEEAISQLQHNKDISVVITDLNMPQMNGIQLLLHLRTHHPKIHNIVISAYSDAENVSLAQKAGARDFLIKPIDFREFEEKLKKLHQENPMPAEGSGVTSPRHL